MFLFVFMHMSSRCAPCGERGLKLYHFAPYVEEHGCAPCGERGLKWIIIMGTIAVRGDALPAGSEG